MEGTAVGVGMGAVLTLQKISLLILSSVLMEALRGIGGRACGCRESFSYRSESVASGRVEK